MMSPDEAIQCLERMGLKTLFYSNTEGIELIGGLEIQEFAFGKTVGLEVSEPGFSIRQQKERWLVIIQDKDTLFERDLCRFTDTLEESVEFIRSLYRKWGVIRDS